jgi:hypothetical protein
LLSLKLQRTSCTWSVTLQTTKTLESILFCLYILPCLISWERTGHLIWRSIYLEGSSVGGMFLCFFFLSFLSPWMDQLSFRYQVVYAIYLEIIIPIPYSIFHTLCYM